MDYGEIPRERLARLHARVHPGFRRRIDHMRIDHCLGLDELVHRILTDALGDPGPLEIPAGEGRPARGLPRQSARGPRS